MIAYESYLTPGDPDKEHRTDKLPPVRSTWEGPKGGERHQPIICPANLPETLTLEIILAERCRGHQALDQIWAQGR